VHPWRTPTGTQYLGAVLRFQRELAKFCSVWWRECTIIVMKHLTIIIPSSCMVITVHVVKDHQHSVHIRCLSRRDGAWDRLSTLKAANLDASTQRWTWQRSTASKVQIGGSWTACYIYM
jgi:hypothetical protein